MSDARSTKYCEDQRIVVSNQESPWRVDLMASKFGRSLGVGVCSE